MPRWLLFLAAMVFLTVVQMSDAAKGRSVLLLIADDLGMGDLGCYGHPDVKTPHLDALAQSAVRFTSAFATTASCSASRSVIYTGLHNHFNGQYGLAHASHHFQQRPHVETLFMLLKANGYRIGLVGKKHVLPETKYPTDFEPRVNPRNVREVARLAKQFLTETADQPFLLIIGYTDPHRAAKGYANQDYPGVTPTRYRPESLTLPYFLPDTPEARHDLAEYYQSVSRMDQGVGMVLEALRQSGKESETLVLFTSDNGMPVPGAKTTVYDPGIRLPLLVRAPGISKSGHVSDAMISFVDITPTLLAWTQTAGPKAYALHGRSFLEILDGRPADDRDEIYASHTFHEVTMYYPMRAIRTKRYKYIWNVAAPLPFPFASDLYASPTWQSILSRKLEWMGKRSVAKYVKRDTIELYDLQKDPHEIHNVASDPAYQSTRQQLSAKLRRFQEKTQDPWLIKYEHE